MFGFSVSYNYPDVGQMMTNKNESAIIGNDIDVPPAILTSLFTSKVALISSWCAFSIKSKLCASTTFQTDVESIDIMYQADCLQRQKANRINGLLKRKR